MLIDFELVNEIFAFGLIRGDIDTDLAGAILAFNKPTIRYV